MRLASLRQVVVRHRYGDECGRRLHGALGVLPPAAELFAVAVGGFGIDRLAECRQQLAELVALLFGEAGEQDIFGFALRSRGADEAALAGRCDADVMPTAVGAASLALDQPVGFERVEHRYEDAVVDRHDVAELALADWSAIDEQVEYLKLARLEVVSGERVAQSAHGLLTQEREQEAGAGTEFLDNAPSDSRGGGSHVQSLPLLVEGGVYRVALLIIYHYTRYASVHGLPRTKEFRHEHRHEPCRRPRRWPRDRRVASGPDAIERRVPCAPLLRAHDGQGPLRPLRGHAEPDRPPGGRARHRGRQPRHEEGAARQA